MAWLKKIVAHRGDLVPANPERGKSDAEAARAARHQAEDALNLAKIRQSESQARVPEIAQIVAASVWVKQQNHLAEMLIKTFERRNP